MIKEKLEIKARGLGFDYYNHKIFDMLSDLESFYGFLSDNSTNYAKGLVLTDIISIDGPIYASMQGSMESIRILVYIGRLNDALTLARKYYDAVTTDVYKSVLIKNEESDFFELNSDCKMIRKESIVRAWTYAQKKLYQGSKDVQDMLKAFREIDENLYKILEENKDKQEKDICNDNVHYNSWKNFVLNNNNGFKKNDKIKALDHLYNSLQIAFCKHFSYIYILQPEFFSSYDYIFALECGEEPEPNSQYMVASIVQTVFDKYVKTYNKDLSEYLLECKIMNLE